jgi:hypothetical protein
MNSLKLTLKFWEPDEKKFYNITVNDPKENLEQAQIESIMAEMIGILVPSTCLVDEATYVQTTYDEIMNIIDN